MADMLATYRLQLHGGFGFEHAIRIVPYLKNLGVSTVYSSPVLRARTGSRHGYDVVDPTQVNPELGGETLRKSWAACVHDHGLSLLLDTVPNHMATGAENPFWEDVLTHGPSSPYAQWFDIDWRTPDPQMRGRVLLPVLGDLRHRVVERDELQLDIMDNRLRLRYFEHTFPLDPSSLPALLHFAANQLKQENPSVTAGCEDFIAALSKLPSRQTRDPAQHERRRAVSRAGLEGFAAFLAGQPQSVAALRAAMKRFQDGPQGRARLTRLMDRQVYRLAYWRRAAREINYRRFFDINDLIALRMHDDRVFEETHGTLLAWVQAGDVDGLRIDHVDGLGRPRAYLERLAGRVGELRHDSFPIFVEKILGGKETLRADWPAAGTTGYEFAGACDALFIDPDGLGRIESHYRRRVLQRGASFADVVRRSKRRALKAELSSSVGRLAREWIAMDRAENFTPEVTLADAAQAIVELIAALPVYRTYIDLVDGDSSVPPRIRIEETDQQTITQAAAEARAGVHAAQALDRLVGLLLMEGAEDLSREAIMLRVKFIWRFQQLCSPAAAKGVEDTAFYVYVPLAARNEVGAHPATPPIDSEARLHAQNRCREERCPASLLAVTTHDTKRSADVRARLSVLSEVADRWKDAVRRWVRWNQPHRRKLAGDFAPDRNTEYLFYQSLVGIWPLQEGTPEFDTQWKSLPERLDQYMLKAVREAKVRSSWVDPDESFEKALADFIRTTMADFHSPFLSDVRRLVNEIAHPGLWNSLSRCAIQFAAPGTPDLYQGDELWNFSLVDPDNRRPVDFPLRDQHLAALQDAWRREDGRVALVGDLVHFPEDGRIKLHVIHRLLLARRSHPRLFASGSYSPLEVSGARAHHLFAFARVLGGAVCIAIAPRLTVRLVPRPLAPPVGESVWGDTVIYLPENFPAGLWRSVLTGELLEPEGSARRGIRAAHALAHCPVAFLMEVES